MVVIRSFTHIFSLHGSNELQYSDISCLGPAEPGHLKQQSRGRLCKRLLAYSLQSPAIFYAMQVDLQMLPLSGCIDKYDDRRVCHNGSRLQ